MPEPAEAAAAPDSLSVIAIVYSMPEAAVLVATLAAYGIFALPRHRGHISVQPGWMIALGGIWIAVPRNQEEDALALLAEIDTGWRLPPRPFADNASLSALLSIVMTFFLMVPPMPRTQGLYGWRCRQSEARPARSAR
ncbi:MAG: hypothetical protein QOH86_398 [Sphingomonadales bacterium]|jgi:hypothetical protein|nr:hypothetical protein [Sphingomonadales bacterium]